jgi:hypothetical protein
LFLPKAPKPEAPEEDLDTVEAEVEYSFLEIPGDDGIEASEIPYRLY